MRRQIALQVHHHVVAPLRIELRQRGVHAVGAARQRRIGQHRDAAGGAHRVGDLGVAAGHRDRADIRPRAPRSSTCTIIGRPWMSASGLPGSRVEAMREGMTTIGFTRRRRGWVDGVRSFPYGARTLWRRTAARNAGPASLRARMIEVRRGSHAAWTAWKSTRALPRSWSPASLFFLTGLIGDALVRRAAAGEAGV